MRTTYVESAVPARRRSARTWCGYDYNTQQSVELTRTEWRELIAAVKGRGGRTVRHKGNRDLLLMESGRIVAEVYGFDR